MNTAKAAGCGSDQQVNGQSARIVRDGDVYRISGPITLTNVEGLLRKVAGCFRQVTSGSRWGGGGRFLGAEPVAAVDA